MNRRAFLASAAALSACSQSPATSSYSEKKIAVTMDDFALGFDKVLSPLERNAAILAAFKSHSHKAAGFVSGNLATSDGARSDLAHEVIKSWSDAGHLIGNHTWSHKNSSQTEPEIVKADILRNDEYLAQFTAYEKVFRFPYLAEGKTVEKIETYRAFMDEKGFQNAAVTIDTIDWFVSERLENRISENPDADLSGYRDYYVDSVLLLANLKHDLARQLGFDALPHSLLVHHNILNGLFLQDVMDALASDGWMFVDAHDMLKHPLYRLKPDTATRGRSLLSVLAQEAGLDARLPEQYRGFGKETLESLGL